MSDDIITIEPGRTLFWLEGRPLTLGDWTRVQKRMMAAARARPGTARNAIVGLSVGGLIGAVGVFLVIWLGVEVWVVATSSRLEVDTTLTGLPLFLFCVGAALVCLMLATLQVVRAQQKIARRMFEKASMFHRAVPLALTERGLLRDDETGVYFAPWTVVTHFDDSQAVWVFVLDGAAVLWASAPTEEKARVEAAAFVRGKLAGAASATPA